MPQHHPQNGESRAHGPRKKHTRGAEQQRRAAKRKAKQTADRERHEDILDRLDELELLLKQDLGASCNYAHKEEWKCLREELKGCGS